MHTKLNMVKTTTSGYSQFLFFKQLCHTIYANFSANIMCNTSCKNHYYIFLCHFSFLSIYVYSNIVHDFVDALVMYNSIKLAAQ